MKKLITLIVLLVAVPVMAQEPNLPVIPEKEISVWLIGVRPDLTHPTRLDALLGIKKENIEGGFGLSLNMYDLKVTDPNNKDKNSNFAFGIYTAISFPEVIDINNPIPLDWLPEKVVGEPGIGLSILTDKDFESLSIRPFTFIKFFEVITAMVYYEEFTGVSAPSDYGIAICGKWQF